MRSGDKSRSATRFARRVCWVLLVGGFLSVVPVQKSIDGEVGVYGPVADILYMPSGEVLRRLSMGHEGLLADIYWTRVVQYFGRKRLAREVRFELLAPLLRVTTTLDPHLLIAYRFGAIFLTEKAPGGADQPQEALQLLRRGIVANPDYWRLWQDLGFIYYWELKDYKKAAEIFRVGSERPGAEFWMKAMAANIAAKGGELETSILLWSEIERNAGNETIRKTAQEHLAALAAQGQMQKLDDLLAEYRKREGRQARSFRDLVEAGMLRGYPLDPSGVQYIVTPDGRAALGSGSRVNLRLLD